MLEGGVTCDWVRVYSIERAFEELSAVHTTLNYFASEKKDCTAVGIQGVSQLLKQSDWAQIQDFKWYHNDDYIYWKVKR